MVASGEELVKICRENGIPIWEYAIREEALRSETSREEVVEKMRRTLHVMMDSSTIAQEQEVKSISGLIGGDVQNQVIRRRGQYPYRQLYQQSNGQGHVCFGSKCSHGQNCGLPTAGSCGILPAVILSAGRNSIKLRMNW